MKGMRMPKFRKKSATVEAIQWDGTWDGAKGIVDLIDSLVITKSDCLEVYKKGQILVRASPGDWIVKNAEGRFFPCDPVAFDEFYEPVE